MNKLLQRQLQKHFGKEDQVPASFTRLLNVISESYDHYEKDRGMIERSIELSSKEMIELNSQLKKIAKDELEKAHKQLKTLLEDIDEVLYSVDMISYKLIQMSAVCEKVYGYTAAEFLADDALWQKVVHAEDKHIAEQQVRSLSQGKQVVNQYRIIHKDGSIRWIENKIISTLDETGRLIRIDGVTSDISERKRAEKEVEESVSILEATIESTADGILVVDFNGKIVRFNKKFVELTRIPQEILDTRDDEMAIGFILDQLINPEPFLSKAKELYDQKEAISFDIIKFKDGRILERYSQPQLINGNSVGRVWSFRDITEKKKAEAALLKRESQLILGAQMAKLGYWEFDVLTDRFTFTDQFFDIFKTTAEKAGGHTMPSAHYAELFVHPDDRAVVGQGVMEAINSDDASFSYKNEHRIIYSNGEIGYISVHYYIVKDDNGRTIRTFGVNQDITERKKVEETLRISEINLEIKNTQLEQKNIELEQFAYVASHDLQEPLRTTISFVKLLQKQYQGKLDAKADKYINYILEASERMKLLIKNLLDYSRIGNKKELEQVDCNTVLHNVLADLGIAIREAGAVIQYDPLPVIDGYATELKQLFQNLITNAIKFRKKDTAPIINISAEKNESYWQFAFKDNGIGIKEEQHERIFVIFQRLHNQTEYQGSGIGLSHCKKIVELHKGEIWVESKPGEGSVFYFTIPLKQ